MTERNFNDAYTADYLSRVAFPMGGIGAGMLCLEGSGALSHVSLRHKPDIFNEPRMFAALYVAGAKTARVIEGPVPSWKAFGIPYSGLGYSRGCAAGLARFANCDFQARFPFARVRLDDPAMPLTVEITGWSPFVPGDADSASLPVAALEYSFSNATADSQSAVFSFHASNFMAVKEGVAAMLPDGFVLTQPACADAPHSIEGSFTARIAEPDLRVDCAWFRGGWFDPLTMLWKTVGAGEAPARPPHATGKPGDGASLYLPLELQPGETRVVTLKLAWYVPHTELACRPAGHDPKDSSATDAYYAPWYAARFKNVEEMGDYWHSNYEKLRSETRQFSDCLYDTSLPPEVMEAVGANLTILKSPTCLRQADGRFWAWEGCGDSVGSCSGSCTHVWNYAQAMPHLLPELERTMRETEFGEDQDEQGHQAFRSALPIVPNSHEYHAAADGQLGGIMKIYREWRICGDTAWLKSLWPRVKQSLIYCIETWDPDHKGLLLEPHHNTYDIEFWGANGMCTSFYLGALAAAVVMGEACADDTTLFAELWQKGCAAMECELWNGEYFCQKTQWEGLRANPASFKVLSFHDTGYSPEALELLQREGPKYQYGNGCLSDGVLGDWIARCSGLASGLAPDKIRRHLLAVFKHNFKPDLSDHSNSQRPTYALGSEGGLLLCTWPEGDKPSLPFVYSDEVWTGIEYQVASHLIMLGCVEEGLTIVRRVRQRYDGRVRNPFNEYECGHWYARAMSSYALLQAFSGARYDAVDGTLYLKPALAGDFHCFLATASGYGTVGLRKGQPFLDVKHGAIEVRQIKFSPD